MSSIEILGYVGMAFVVSSFIGKSMFTLRLLNVIGASIITVYALLIDAWPMVWLNSLLAVINAYHLFLLLQERRGVQKED
jgi:hypothetical protein